MKFYMFSSSPLLYGSSTKDFASFAASSYVMVPGFILLGAMISSAMAETGS